MGILEGLIGLLIIFWLAGFVLHVAGGLIHILLVIALVLIIFRFIGGNK